jgi:hypothetical protein
MSVPGRALTHAKRIGGSPSVDLDRRQATHYGRSTRRHLDGTFWGATVIRAAAHVGAVIYHAGR